MRITGDHRISIRFPDKWVAELHLADWIASQEGPMIEPLKSPSFFADLDIDNGVLTWPNGYDIDPLTVRHWAEEGM